VRLEGERKERNKEEGKWGGWRKEKERDGSGQPNPVFLV
jgi:hypothetical protein